MGSWTPIGSVAAKSFLDDSLPSGAAWAQCRVKRHRGAEGCEGSEPIAVLAGGRQQQAA